MGKIQFKQFCYTHTNNGIYISKGWQAVGVSDKDFFQPFLPNIYSAITISEAAALQKEYGEENKFQIFGLRTIADFPVLVKITGAGQTADNRPGNIFVHMLFATDEKDIQSFYNSDVMSIFQDWDGWLSEWTGEANEKMPIVELKIDAFPNENILKQADGFTNLNDHIVNLVAGGEIAVNRRRPQYLLIQPPEKSEADAVFPILRTIWSWMPISERRLVQLWVGRNQVKLPGTNWVVLNRSNTQYIRDNMLNRQAYCFDFEHDKFTTQAVFDTAFKEGQIKSRFSPDKLRQRNEYFGMIQELLGYHGFNESIHEALFDILNDSKVSQNKTNFSKFFMSKQDVLLKAFKGLKQSDGNDEYFSSFRSLMKMAHQYGLHLKKSPQLFIDSAFKLNFSSTFFKEYIDDVDLVISTSILNTRLWEAPIDGEAYQGFLSAVSEGLIHLGAKSPDFKARCSYYKIWNEFALEAGSENAFFEIFKTMCLNEVLEKGTTGLASYFSQLDEAEPKNWLNDSGQNSDEERQWMKNMKFIVQNKNAQNGLPGLILSIKNTVEEKIAYRLVDDYVPEAEDQIKLWSELYKKIHSQKLLEKERIDEFLNKYFESIAKSSSFDAASYQVRTLMNLFLENDDLVNVNRECKSQLIALSDQTQDEKVDLNNNKGVKAKWKYKDEKQVIEFFRNLLISTKISNRDLLAKVLSNDLPNYLQTYPLLLKALFLDQDIQKNWGIKELREIRDLNNKFRGNKVSRDTLEIEFLDDPGIIQFRRKLLETILNIIIKDPSDNDGLGYLNSFKEDFYLTGLYTERASKEILIDVFDKLLDDVRYSKKNLDLLIPLFNDYFDKLDFDKLLTNDLVKSKIKMFIKAINEEFATALNREPISLNALEKMKVQVFEHKITQDWIEDLTEDRKKLLGSILKYLLSIKNNTRIFGDLSNVIRVFKLNALITDFGTQKKLQEIIADEKVGFEGVERLVSGLSNTEEQQLNDFSSIVRIYLSQGNSFEEKDLFNSDFILKHNPSLYFYKWFFKAQLKPYTHHKKNFNIEFFSRCIDKNEKGFKEEMQILVERKDKTLIPFLEKQSDPIINGVFFKFKEMGSLHGLDVLLDKILSLLAAPTTSQEDKNNLARIVERDIIKPQHFSKETKWKERVENAILAYFVGKGGDVGIVFSYLKNFFPDFNNIAEQSSYKRKLQKNVLLAVIDGFSVTNQINPSVDIKQVASIADYFKLTDYLKSQESKDIKKLFNTENKYDFGALLEILETDNKGKKQTIHIQIDEFIKSEKRNLKNSQNSFKGQYNPIKKLKERTKDDPGFFPLYGFMQACVEWSEKEYSALPLSFEFVGLLENPDKAKVEEISELVIHQYLNENDSTNLKTFIKLLFYFFQDKKRELLEVFLTELNENKRQGGNSDSKFKQMLIDTAKMLCECVENVRLNEKETPKCIKEFLKQDELRHYYQRLKSHSKGQKTKNDFQGGSSRKGFWVRIISFFTRKKNN